MSKYLGKLLLESGAFSETEIGCAYVKYVQGSDMFCFKVGTKKVYTFVAGAGLVFAMCKFRGYLECQYKWSTGYVVKEKKGLEEFKSMRNDELLLLGGRRELIMSDQLDNDYDFDLLCCLQYKYQFSDTFFKRVKGHWRRGKTFVEMKLRDLGKSGRKKGSKNREDPEEYVETVDDIVLRCEHNKAVALKKGILEWYIEANKELCKAQGIRFDKDKCVEQWNELRRECE